MWGDDLNYTEEEKKGIDKVERMNRLFDTRIMPAIGIVIILMLISFTVSKFKEKFYRGGVPTESAVQNAEPEIFALRRSLLGGYDAHKEEFAAYGYEPVDGYTYGLSLCKSVDDEMVIFQFRDDSLGELTIINYVPGNTDAAYVSLSLAVSSHRLLNVTVKSGGEKHSVTFTDTDFSEYQPEDAEEFKCLMKLTDMDDIRTMYEIFETDIRNLSDTVNHSGNAG